MKKICVLGGGRIPFQPSGTIYKNMSNIDLVKLAINGVLTQTNIEKHRQNIDKYADSDEYRKI